MDKNKLERLEKSGLQGVLNEIAEGHHGAPDSPARLEVDSWIKSKQFALDSASAAKRDAREEKTLRIAIAAIIIAAISIVIQILDKLL